MVGSCLTSCPDTPRRYTAFQVVGAWANTGFSLVDQNLVPFQTAYPLLIFEMWLALAGNTAFVSALVPISHFVPKTNSHSLFCACGLFTHTVSSG
jgi:Trk-type K+ transport system membrane component